MKLLIRIGKTLPNLVAWEPLWGVQKQTRHIFMCAKLRIESWELLQWNQRQKWPTLLKCLCVDCTVADCKHIQRWILRRISTERRDWSELGLWEEQALCSVTRRATRSQLDAFLRSAVTTDRLADDRPSHRSGTLRRRPISDVQSRRCHLCPDLTNQPRSADLTYEKSKQVDLRA